MTNPRLIDVIKAAVAQAKLDAHPVGSLYWSREAADPSTLFGGVWQRVKDRFVLAAGDSYAAGAEGGEAAHTLTLAEAPAHTHTRGTMEITGTLTYNTSDATSINSAGSNFASYPTRGALRYGSYAYGSGATLTTASGSNKAGRDVVFKGSNGWTGETSSAGGGSAHNNMPPYATYYCWERIE